VVLTATIANGESATTNYTQEFTITISAEGAFVAVTGITGVPEDGVAGSPVSLAGATVVPSNATNKTISWTVATPGAGVTSITGSSFTPTTAGTVTLTARILSGLGDGPYTQDFTFEIAAAFLAVSDISGLPTALVTGTEIDLNAGVSVVPPEATNKDIVWSIKPGAANTTGLTDATVATGVFTPQAGTVTLTATILNGRGQGSNFTKDTAAITIITPVTGITGVPSEGTKGYVVDLSGASVEPSAATNKTIVWSVTSAGDTGVTTAGIVGGKFTPAGTGNLVLTATIANGSAVGTAFEQEYPITIYEPGEFSPGFGFGDDTSILLRGGADQVQLSRDTAIEIAKDSVYYVSLITSGGNYTDVVWYLNGAKQTIGGSGALIYLDTSTARTISLAVIGTRGGLLEGSGIYTFTIK
jgi:hypothetical protein